MTNSPLVRLCSADTYVVDFLPWGSWGGNCHVVRAEKLTHSVKIAPALIVAVLCDD
jgi:hypothetical protein